MVENITPTTVATSRHLQSAVNNIVAGVATGGKGKIYIFFKGVPATPAIILFTMF